MKRIVLILLLLIFQFNSFSYDSKLVNKIAEDEVKNQLHSELEKKLGKDVPVESVFQVLDHIANGEFKQAKMVASEELAQQFVNILVGSEAGGLIGVAWNFAKFSFTSVQQWSDRFNMQKFTNEFLKPQVEMWEKSGKVPPWNEVKNQMLDWINFHENTILAIKLPTERKSALDAFTKEAWNKTFEIHTKFKKYYFLKKQAEMAAKMALNEYQRHLTNLKIHYKRVARFLELAGLPINAENLKRFDNDQTFRILVGRVADINLSLKKDDRISLKQYVSIVNFLGNLKSGDIKDACIKLKKANFEVNPQNVRLFILNEGFKKKVLEKLKESGNNQNNNTNENITNEDVKQIKENIYNFDKTEFTEIVSDTPISLEDRLTEISKQLYNTFHKDINNFDFSPLLNYYSNLIDSFTSGEITFERFLNLREKVYNEASKYTLSESEDKNQWKKWQEFNKTFKQYDSRFISKRKEALKTIDNIKREICINDDLIQKIYQAKIKLNKLNGNKINKIYEEEKTQFFNNLNVTGYRFSLPTYLTLNTLNEKIKTSTSELKCIEDKIKLLEREVNILNDYAGEYYIKMHKLTKKLEDKYSEIGYLLEGYPAKWKVFPPDFFKPYYTELEYKDPCDLNVEEHYLKGMDEISEMESELFLLSNIYQQLQDYKLYLENQKLLNKEISGLLAVDLNSLIQKISKEKGDKLFNLENKAGELEGILTNLVISYNENIKSLNSNFHTPEEVISEVKKKRNTNTYLPLSVYRQQLDRLKSEASNCHSYVKALEDDYHSLKRYISLVRGIASKIEAWDEDILKRYEKFDSGAREIIEINVSDKKCNYLNEIINNCETQFKKLSKIENRIINVLNMGINQDNLKMYSDALNEAEILPFKPSFDIETYRSKLNDYLNANYSVYCKFPEIEEVFVNGKKVSKYIYLIPSDLKGNRIEVRGKYKVFGKNKSCYPKEITLRYPKGIAKCKLLPDNEFVCYLEKPSIENSYTVIFHIESNRKEVEEPLFVTINFVNSNSNEIDKYLNTFLDYYNNNKDINKFFSGFTYRNELIKNANENRKKFKHNLIFEQTTLENMKTYEKDPDFRMWTAKVKVKWRTNGDINKSGTAYVYITKHLTVTQTSTYTLIDKIEGDSFLNSFAKKQIKDTGYKIALISHGQIKGGGYSLDFETNTYSNREKDIAAGYVNPNAKEEGYDKPYFNVGFIIDMGRVPIESVKQCPKTGYSDYYENTPAIKGHTYCVRTLEGNYVKLYVLETGGTGFKAYIKFKWKFCK
ncbi:conserved hypothetical protein [Thermotomaculum hydrothermale]|uniref:Uncharacterized protein n=1 Tax=Thermotomaculum hydrothermale TaxID=981385 RepID=A0A7R6SXR6_9BACT|nr:hypothetical protein [Thermotomaculum hydrothermale]BBB32084.1 conserved hypothetical protein [Thermotomaculum hydrothermale]